MKKQRNVNIDLIKLVAVFSVISVHFFAYTGFYEQEITNISNYVMILFRTLFMICVPLFMITTGYLMNNKKLNKKYYLGIIRVLITYLLASLIYLSYQCIYLKEGEFTIRHIISSILNFDIGYSWYIEMYLGMYLIIPFLNLVYNNLENRKQKNQLLITMFITTALQGIINIKYNLIPDWWINIFPVTYYFIGCYIKEYKPNIKKKTNIIYILLTLIISVAINIYLSNNTIFNRGIHNDWGSILNVLLSIFIFIFIINLDLKKLNNKIKRIIVKLSELSLAIYLSSSVIDNFIYYHFLKEYTKCSIKGYITLIPLIFILSTSLSMIMNYIYYLLNKYIIKKLIKNNL